MIVPENQPSAASEGFSKAKLLLGKLLYAQDPFTEHEDRNREQPHTVYTNAVVLWLLTLQRLGGGLSFDAVVKELLENHRELLPEENRRVQEGTLSLNNSAYNKARKKLSLSKIRAFSQFTCDMLSKNAERPFQGKRVFILDGTTITLPPTDELRREFPPANNQHGKSVWPIAQLLVAHELQTGCAMVPQIDPMYGSNNQGETSQATAAIASLPSHSIVMADSAFGIFQVAWQCQCEDQDFLFRLTKARFRSHLKHSELVAEGQGYRTYARQWQPSSQERKKYPDLPADATVNVAIHQIELDNGTTLELITSLEVDAASAANLYCRRYDVEFDIRDLKVTMDTENMRSKSKESMLKELLGSIIAYNLAMQFRAKAAKLAGVRARRLSFTGVWLDFRVGLLGKEVNTLEEGNLAYQKALVAASGRLLPNRKKARTYPRVAHTRRPKTTKYQKELVKKKAADKKRAEQETVEKEKKAQTHRPPE